MLAGLAARARDARSFPAKRGTPSLNSPRIFRKAVNLIVTDASTAPTGPRAEKAKKNKNSVPSINIWHLYLINLPLSLSLNDPSLLRK